MAFVGLNAVALSLADEGRVTATHLWAPAWWAGLMLAAHVVLNRFRPNRDPLLFPIFALLTGWGLLLIDRLAPNFLGRQALWISLATGALLLSSIVPDNLNILRRYRYTWLTFGLLLLGATLVLGVNPSGSGAALWLKVPLLDRVYFQPSELLKLLLVAFLASYFDEQLRLEPFRTKRDRRSHIAFLAPLVIMWGFCIILLIWQRDLGAATLFFVTFLTLLYLATGEWRYVIGGAGLLTLAGVLGYFVFDVVRLRVDAWWNPWPDATDRAFQIVQSLYAVASGGLSGQGIGQGAPTFVPVVHSDFAFAAIAEEWGLIGSVAVLCCFTILAFRGLRISALCRRPFHAFLAAGMTIMLSVQSFLIVAGVIKVMPLTGITLPFISYGGSSLLMSGVMLGLLLHLSHRASSRP
jgi:cell division protein FtsW (lipid II flippase)